MKAPRSSQSPCTPMNDPSYPEGWSRELDFLVLVGAGCADLARREREAGQSRLFVVAPTPVPGLPEGVEQVRAPQELLAPILGTAGSAPRQVVVHRTSDPWATVERRDAVVQATREAVRSRAAQLVTLERNAATWMRQALLNLPSIARWPSVTSLFGRFAGRTAFVCAPGPSLSEALPHLRAHRDDCLVISVSHALHSLQRAGITPDLVLVADPGNLERHFQGVDTSGVAAIVAAATARTQIFEQPSVAHFHFASNGRIDDWLYGALGQDTRLPSGGSVSCSAVSLAMQLGCTTVVCCGLDLGFPGGRYYARESLDGDATVEVEDGRFFLRKEAGSEGSDYALEDGGLRFSADQRLLELPSVNGGTVHSSPAMRVYLSWFESTASERNGQVRLVQTSPDGAYIAGFDHRPAADEVARVVRAPRHDRLRATPLEVVRATVQAHDDQAAAGRLRDYFRRIAEAVPVVRSLSGELIRVSRLAVADEAALQTLQDGERCLREALQPLPMMSLLTYTEIERAKAEAAEGQTLADNLRASRRIFTSVERATQLLEPALREGLAALERDYPEGARVPSAEAA